MSTISHRFRDSVKGLERESLLLCISIASYASFFVYYTILKHYAFRTLMFDLGVYDHMFWMFVNHGQTESLLGIIHHSVILYAVASIYALFQSPVTLLVIQSIVVPLGAIPLYKLARHELRSSKLALAVASAYLLYPPLHGLSQFGFHVELFLPPLFLLSFYYLRTGRWMKHTAANILLALTITYAAFLLLLLGFYNLVTALRVRWAKRAVALGLRSNQMKAAILTILIAVAFIIMHTSLIRFSELNPSIYSVKRISALPEQKIRYIVDLFGPLGFAPLINPGPLVMAAPWLVSTISTTEPEYLKIHNQYSAYTAPFLFASFVGALKRFRSRRARTAVLMGTLMTTLIFVYVSDPVSNSPWPTIGYRESLLHSKLAEVSPEAGVLTQNNIAPHLTRRENIYMRPVGAPTFGPSDYRKVDYIIVDTRQYHYYYAPVPEGYPYDATKVAVEQLLETNDYQLVFHYDGIFVYRRK